MTRKISVDRALTPDGSGTINFTAPSGFGTPTAAMFFLVDASVNGTVNQSIQRHSIGLTDGTTELCVANRVHAGQTTTGTRRVTSNTGAVVARQISALTASTLQEASFTKWLTQATDGNDGVQVTWTRTTAAGQLFLVCVMFKADSANAGTFTPNSTQNGTASKTGLSFQPNMLIAIGAGQGMNASDSHKINSFGIAVDTGAATKQYAIMSFNESGLADVDQAHRFDSTAITGQYFQNAVGWTGEITAWNSDGFTMTTRDGATGGDEIGYLALDMPLELDMQEITSPVTTGTTKITTSFAPEAVIGAFATAATSINGSSIESACFFAGDLDAEYSVTVGDDDGAPTSDPYNLSDTKIIHTLNNASGTVSSYEQGNIGTSGSWDSDGVTIDWTTVQSTAYQGWALLVGNPAGGLSIPVAMASYRRRRV